MVVIFVQLLVAALAGVLAGLKGLRFAPSGLTDFELRRRARTGDEQAQAEQRLRAERPLLDGLRRLVVLVLTIVLVLLLAAVYNFVLAIVWALGWLLVVELLAARGWLNACAERLAGRYQTHLLRVANTLRPVLRLLADNRLLGTATAATFYSKPELLQAVEADTGVLNREEKLLVRQALSYQSMRVSDIMTPRSVVVTVSADDTVGPLLLDRLHKSGHSRFPVVEGDLDHVRGVLYMHELVPLDPKARSVGDAMSHKVFFVHQDKQLDHVLQAFLRTKHHLFMVVNEFEEVTGVVSIEDVLEAIIGRKIVDEFDEYEDLRAVAKLAASERRKARGEDRSEVT